MSIISATVHYNLFTVSLRRTCWRTANLSRIWDIGTSSQRTFTLVQSLGHRHGYAIEVSQLPDLGCGIICRLNFDSETYA